MGQTAKQRFRNNGRSSIRCALKMSTPANNDNTDEVDQLRQTASKLRAEAQEAEKALESSRGTAASGEGTQYIKPVEYLDLRDSNWEITYRFANEPVSNNDDDDDKSENKPQRKFYSGKLQLQFRGDGYTDIVSPSGEVGTGSTAIFQKVWGWDLETSNEDSLDYLLFSADIALPPPISTSERFYFQARVDKEGKDKDVLSLQDGSVTVKRDVETPAGWGIFRGASSILAQFRQVGEFRCRPIPNPEL
ncbi:hypothetical protein ACHAXR_001121 [Thalassiosira sp. AJA248-18]